MLKKKGVILLLGGGLRVKKLDLVTFRDFVYSKTNSVKLRYGFSIGQKSSRNQYSMLPFLTNIKSFNSKSLK